MAVVNKTADNAMTVAHADGPCLLPGGWVWLDCLIPIMSWFSRYNFLFQRYAQAQATRFAKQFAVTSLPSCSQK